MKALLLDIGNSRIKWGVLEAGGIRRTGHISRERLRERGLQVLTTKLPSHVDTVFVSNVAGTSFATRLSGVVGMHCDCEVHFARPAKRGWGVQNRYAQPRRMGVDRWVALVGAWSALQDACLVVDMGTAITLDAIDAEGAHLGGQILPGVAAMAAALSSATSDIPALRQMPARGATGLKMFAGTTAACVGEGVHNAAAGAIDRALNVLEDGGHAPTVVLTGGDASRILAALSVTPLHRPHLVLQGLAFMLENPQ